MPLLAPRNELWTPCHRTASKTWRLQDEQLAKHAEARSGTIRALQGSSMTTFGQLSARPIRKNNIEGIAGAAHVKSRDGIYEAALFGIGDSSTLKQFKARIVVRHLGLDIAAGS